MPSDATVAVIGMHQILLEQVRLQSILERAQLAQVPANLRQSALYSWSARGLDELHWPGVHRPRHWKPGLLAAQQWRT